MQYQYDVDYVYASTGLIVSVNKKSSCYSIPESLKTAALSRWCVMLENQTEKYTRIALGREDDPLGSVV